MLLLIFFLRNVVNNVTYYQRDTRPLSRTLITEDSLKRGSIHALWPADLVDSRTVSSPGRDLGVSPRPWEPEPATGAPLWSEATLGRSTRSKGPEEERRR